MNIYSSAVSKLVKSHRMSHEVIQIFYHFNYAGTTICKVICERFQIHRYLVADVYPKALFKCHEQGCCLAHNLSAVGKTQDVDTNSKLQVCGRESRGEEKLNAIAVLSQTTKLADKICFCICSMSEIFSGIMICKINNKLTVFTPLPCSYATKTDP